jgi:hypothetical protein
MEAGVTDRLWSIEEEVVNLCHYETAGQVA